MQTDPWQSLPSDGNVTDFASIRYVKMRALPSGISQY
jgi:hypothetical protein